MEEMEGDVQHRRLSYRFPELDHAYGDNVHILADPLALTLLARLGQKGVIQPEVTRLLDSLYRTLVHTVVAAEFPRETRAIPTRMIDSEERGVWTGETIAASSPAVVVALARAGLVPAQVTFDFLNQVLDPQHVRQDHLSLGRQTDTAGRVIGVNLGAAKIGGSVEKAMLLIPDPMGATGNTITTALGHYQDTVVGRPARVIAMHLIVTPEYLRHVATHHPGTIVYALRLDRGLSAPDVLDATPGTRWSEEKGLNAHQYVVPGAGGLGEVMNNSWV